MIDRPVVGLVATQSPDFVAQAFACWRAGAAVVTLRSKDDHERLRLAGGAEIRVPTSGDGWLEARLEPRDDAGVAQILFTSGTEGEPKGVVLTHQNLSDVVTRLNSAMSVSSEIREYIGVPVYHSFGFGRCRAVSEAGGAPFYPHAALTRSRSTPCSKRARSTPSRRCRACGGCSCRHRPSAPQPRAACAGSRSAARR